MNSTVELRMRQARQIIDNKSPTMLQYLLPVLKLIKAEYMENSELELNEPILTFLINTIEYLMEISANTQYDHRLVIECSLVISRLIVFVHNRIRIFI